MASRTLIVGKRRAQFTAINQSMNPRFDEAIAFWREELRGFEERMVARPEHLE
jgi:hypothetical protein